MTEFAVGIDIGGTFTDVVALDLKTGKYATAKVLTTPENPQLGAINGVDKILGTNWGSKANKAACSRYNII